MPAKKQNTILDSLSVLANSFLKLGGLYVEKARLKATERLTILLSTVAFAAIGVALALILLIFISIGVGHLLAASIAPHLAYLIVAGFYLVLFILLIVLRKPLFINPISRFMSRLLLEAPDEESPRRAKRAQEESNVTLEEGGES